MSGERECESCSLFSYNLEIQYPVRDLLPFGVIRCYNPITNDYRRIGMKKANYLKYIISLLLFGSNGIVASNISLNSFEIVFFRALIGSVFLLVLFLCTSNKFSFYKYKKDFVGMIVSGIAMGASWVFLFEAYTQIGVSISTLLYYTGPAIVMILSPILFQEKLTTKKIGGFLAVLCGLALINGNIFYPGANLFGIFCGIMSALMYATMIVFNKKATNIKGVENSLLQLVIAFLAVGAFVGIKQGYSFQISSADWKWLLVLGVFNTGIGCYCYFSAIGNLPVQTVAICGYIDPLAAVVFSFLILHETMLPIQMLGACFIIGGALVSEVKGIRIASKKGVNAYESE